MYQSPSSKSQYLKSIGFLALSVPLLGKLQRLFPMLSLDCFLNGSDSTLGNICHGAEI